MTPPLLSPSLEYLSHGGEEFLTVLLGRDNLSLDLQCRVGLLTEHLKLLLELGVCQVVNNSEVNLALDDAVTGVEDDLLDDVAMGEFLHLVSDLVAVGEVLLVVLE